MTARPGEQAAAAGAFGPFPFYDRWRAAHPAWAVLLPLICALPVLTGLAGRLIEGAVDYVDFQTVVCAGWRSLHDMPVYTQGFECPGMRVAWPDYPYLYAPWIYRAVAGVLGAAGEGVIWAVYLPLFWGGIAFVIAWTLKGENWSLDAMASRAPFLALWVGGPIAWGNIGLPLHALALAGALIIERRPLVFALIVALATALKPQMAIYAVVPVFALASFWRGCVYAVFAVIVGFAPTVLSFLWESPDTLAA